MNEEFKMKMMPGETPYTPEELERLEQLLRHAAEAEEGMSSEELDELEREIYARRNDESRIGAKEGG